jgi:hypothetical protein
VGKHAESCSSTRVLAAELLSSCNNPHSGILLVVSRNVCSTMLLLLLPGTAFYRAESAQGRDLAVLAAAVYKRQHGRLRVLDVMSGSGMRGARYLTQVDILQMCMPYKATFRAQAYWKCAS